MASALDRLGRLNSHVHRAYQQRVSQASQDGGGPRRFGVEDAQALKTVGSPAVSPCGGWIAYTVTEKDLPADSSETSLWMAPAGGGPAVRMTAPGSSAAGSPAFSPCGTMLCFTASRPTKTTDGDALKTTQVWAFKLTGGDALPLTQIKQGVGSYLWSPDLANPRLLLTVKDPDPEDDEADGQKKADDKAKKKPQPWVMDRQQFKRDYAGYLHNRLGHTHLYIQEGGLGGCGSGSVRQITSGEFDEGSPAWCPHGLLVAFASNRTENPDGNSSSNIWVVAADNTDEGATLVQITADDGLSNGSPTWSLDGKTIAYLTQPSHPTAMWYSTLHLAVAPSDGSAKTGTVLTYELDRSLSSPEYAKDGSGLIWATVTDSGTEWLGAFDPAGGAPAVVAGGEISIRSFASSGTATALLVSSGSVPGELYMLGGHVAAADRPLIQLTYTNDELLAGLELASVKKVAFPCDDVRDYSKVGSVPIFKDTVNHTVEMFVYKPPGFIDGAGFKYPTLLWIHGGPVSQYDFAFAAAAQLFAARGFVVLQVNPRGSSGRGEPFCQALFADWGGPALHDVMTAVDYAVAAGWSDEDRLAVGGWSYGGILTNHVITNAASCGRFKAAMTGASSTLYKASYGHDQYQLHWEQELGLPWINSDTWEAISPFNDMANVQTPTLVVCGEVDWNVPVQNSDQLYQGLKRLGVDTQLVVYPGEHHGIRLPSFEKDRYERWFAWFDKAKGATAEETAAVVAAAATT